MMEFHLDAFEYKELEERLIGNIPIRKYCPVSIKAHLATV